MLKKLFGRNKQEDEDFEIIVQEDETSEVEEFQEEEELETEEVVKKLKTMQKERNKKERFIRSRMWFSTLISKFYPDRVQIPPNIGNNIFVGNNQIVTKYSISSMVIIRELSDKTPVALFSEVIKEVKSKVPGVYVDVTVKSTNYYPDLNASGLKSRISQWERTEANAILSARIRDRATRLLYTVKVARKKTKLYKSHIYFIVRANNGLQLKQAMKILEAQLDSYDIAYKAIKSNVLDHLKYTSLLSSRSGDHVRDIPTTITSSTILAEMLPVIQGLNDERGNFLGLNLDNFSPYNINFRASRKAKNIYVLGLSGHGKTFIVITWAIDAYAIGYHICAADMKGNEFVPLANAIGGTVISLRQESKYFLNTLRMSRSAIHDNGPDVYFNTNLGFTKLTLLYAADVRAEDRSLAETLIDEFLENFYAINGVLKDNPMTWYRTDNMHPLHIYDAFKRFLSKEHIRKYGIIAERMLMRFKSYFHKSGSNSHMFGIEIKTEEAYNTKMLVFDFGLLNSEGVRDTAAYNIRNLYMMIMNDGYGIHNLRKGLWTFKILEESQIADEYLDIYAKEFSLKRAQQQVTVMLGNSVTAIANHPSASAIIENINILVVGVVNKTGRDYIIKEFGLEEHQDTLNAIATNPDYEHQFLIVNKMQKNATASIIKTYVPRDVAKKRLFTTITTEDE